MLIGKGAFFVTRVFTGLTVMSALMGGMSCVAVTLLPPGLPVTDETVSASPRRTGERVVGQRPAGSSTRYGSWLKLPLTFRQQPTHARDVAVLSGADRETTDV